MEKLGLWAVIWSWYHLMVFSFLCLTVFSSISLTHSITAYILDENCFLLLLTLWSFISGTLSLYFYCQTFNEIPHSKLLILPQVYILTKSSSPKKHVKEHTVEVIIDIQYYEISVSKSQWQNCMFLYFLNLWWPLFSDQTALSIGSFWSFIAQMGKHFCSDTVNSCSKPILYLEQ